MNKFLLCLSALLAPAAAIAQDAPKSVSYGGHQWRVTARSAGVEQYLGRDTLALSGGRLWLDDVDFSDGVIEFDVAYEERQGFIGPIWRAENDRHFEEIYFRSHLSGKPDAVQYTPVENGNSAWQIFSDENALAAIDQKFGDWNHVKVVVKDDKADFYFNSNTPQLHIPDLKTDIGTGGVGLRVSGRGGMTAYFSNFAIRPLATDDEIIGEAKEPHEIPEGLLTAWKISSVFSEDIVVKKLTLPKDATNALTWTMLDVETNGIANISKTTSRLTDGGSTVFVRANIHSDRKQMKELRFGYSDRVRIYLNGKRVYSGDAGWTVRDYRFLGTVGFFDSAGLDLERGDNDLMIAISETFGGWAWAGAIEDQSGITIEN